VYVFLSGFRMKNYSWSSVVGIYIYWKLNASRMDSTESGAYKKWLIEQPLVQDIKHKRSSSNVEKDLLACRTQGNFSQGFNM
jgi:hypothetical protein